jgi:hypothetical protein
MGLLEPVYRNLAQPSYASLERSAAFIAGATVLGPNNKTFSTQGVMAGAVETMYDSITVSEDPAGAPVYAGYYDGAFANMGALRARFGSSKRYVAVTALGNRGADYADVEPGDLSNSSIVSFWRSKAPWAGFYTFADNLQPLIDTLAAAGIKRSQYGLWSAHWTGYHICGPVTCGFPAADGTQYASNNAFDTSVISASFWAPVVKPVGPVTPPKLPAAWEYEAPQDLTAQGGHSSVLFNLVPPKTAVGGAKAAHAPTGFEVDVYNNPVQKNSNGSWKLVEHRTSSSPSSRFTIGGLARGSSYLAHVWADGSPASSVSQYASVAFKTG